MPVLNALAARRPVFVRALPVFAELWDALGGDDNMHPYVTTADLVQALSHPPQWSAPGASCGNPRDATRAARDIGHGLDEAIGGASYDRIVRRIRTLPGRQTPVAVAPDTLPASAQVIARAFERVLLKILRLPGVFPLLQRGFGLARRLSSRP